MMIISILLLLTGNMSFARIPPAIQTVSKCQSFVSAVFDKYGLPQPETGVFPVHGDFDLENYNQGKPEFMVMTTPREINKRAPDLAKNTFKQRDHHLKFEGKVLEDGSYGLTVWEIAPKFQQQKIAKHEEVLYKILDIRPIVHTFHFSEECEFKEYLVARSAGINKDGFHVSANSQCEFKEPIKKRGEALAAHILQASGYNYNFLLNEDYIILEYPHYYRGLCDLARDNNEVIVL